MFPKGFSSSHGSRSSSLMAKAAALPMAIGTLAVLGMVTNRASASVIYQDTFSGNSTTPLNGTAPTVDDGGASATWTANTYAVWSASGYTNGNLDQSGKSADSAYLGFTPTAGQIYTLSATLTVSSSIGGGSSLNFGFPGNIQAGTNPLGNTSTLNTGWTWPTTITNLDVSPWVLLGGTGGGYVFTGPDEDSAAYSFTPAAIGNPNNIAIVLNTGGNAWTYQVFDNGAAVSPVVTLNPNPTMTAVGMQNENVIGSIGNFELISSPVPEPATLGLAGVGALGLLLTKRRRAV